MQERRIEARGRRFAIAQQGGAVDAGADELVALGHERGGRLRSRWPAADAGQKRYYDHGRWNGARRLPLCSCATLGAARRAE